jgi:quercetin dioxygenase-like cupin family protein
VETDKSRMHFPEQKAYTRKGTKMGKGIDHSQTIPLAAGIGYSEGSVVSRTIVDKPAGTVTLFAFDEGQRLSEHTAPYDALVQVLEGSVELVIGGKPLVVSAGEAAIMPADIPHSLTAVERFKMLLTMIRG